MKAYYSRHRIQTKPVTPWNHSIEVYLKVTREQSDLRTNKLARRGVVTRPKKFLFGFGALSQLFRKLNARHFCIRVFFCDGRREERRFRLKLAAARMYTPAELNPLSPRANRSLRRLTASIFSRSAINDTRADSFPPPATFSRFLPPPLFAQGQPFPLSTRWFIASLFSANGPRLWKSRRLHLFYFFHSTLPRSPRPS